MLMNEVRKMIERAFQRGAVSREDFQVETNNKESIKFIGPDGTERVLGCYPGSVRVSVRSLLLSPPLCVYIFFPVLATSLQP